MEGSPSGQSRSLRVLWVVLALLVVLLAGLLIWQATGGGDDDGAPAEAPEVPAPRVVDAAELRDVAATSEVPIYWVGPRQGAELELSEADDAQAYVRYLTGGAEAEDPRPRFLTIGTYRLPAALAVLRANADRSGVELRRAARGALAWVDPQSPTSVYVARSGEDFQIEVFDPVPERALEAALSPRLRPVAASQADR